MTGIYFDYHAFRGLDLHRFEPEQVRPPDVDPAKLRRPGHLHRPVVFVRVHRPPEVGLLPSQARPTPRDDESGCPGWSRGAALS
jgi:hypothetical protein